MPYFFDPEESQNQQNQAGENPTGESVFSGTQFVGQGGGTKNVNSAMQGSDRKPTESGSFTNLSAYLDANKGSDFGGRFAGDVGKSVDQAGEAITQAETGFKAQVDQNRKTRDTALEEQIKQNPLAVAQDQQAKAKAIGLRDARYTGPKNLIDSTELYDPARTQITKAQETTGLAQTDEGRRTLLGRFYGGDQAPQYNAGQKNLDNLLVTGDQGAVSALNDRAAQAQAKEQRFSDLGAYLNQYAKGAEADTAAAQAGLTGALAESKASSLKNLDDRVAQRQKEAEAAAAKFARSGASSQAIRDLTEEQRALYGLPDYRAFNSVAYNPGEYGDDRPIWTEGGKEVAFSGANPLLSAASLGDQRDSFFGVDPLSDSYRTLVAKDMLNRNTVANQDDVARFQALSELAGVPSDIAFDSNLVGTLDDESLYSVNADKFRSDVNARRQEFQNQIQGVADDWNKAIAPFYSSDRGGYQLPSGRAYIDRVNSIRQAYGLAPIQYSLRTE